VDGKLNPHIADYKTPLLLNHSNWLDWYFYKAWQWHIQSTNALYRCKRGVSYHDQLFNLGL
jgi:hypothetical protein